MQKVIEFSNNKTQIVHDPDDSIDVEEFIQYPPDMIDSNISDTNQNAEDESHKCIKIKVKDLKNYNEINMGGSR